ncbi:MAG TPA: hypothetical protein DEB40_00910 [Elusimicrobia bacterium]|nr:hypothetical protein [Elusimicrobiota bacterium]HBT60289.1 hypothetical protein [Elusimicrobiota bacterium]
MGLGHLGRSAALAQAFRELGARPVFVDVPASCRFWVRSLGFDLAALSSRRWDILAADSYRFSPQDWQRLRRQSRNLLAFDDLGTCRAPADWILNGHVYARGLRFSAGPAAGLLLGPKFLPLRQEYWSPSLRRRISPRIRRLLITLGGGICEALTETVIKAAQQALPQAEIHVAIGMLAPKPASVAATAVVWHRGLMSLRPLLESCDAAVTAGGQTIYELAFTGTPAAVVERGPDQKGNVLGMAEAGTVLLAGKAAAPGLAVHLRAALRRIDRDPALRARMSESGRGLIDGHGALRVARLVLGQSPRRP